MTLTGIRWLSSDEAIQVIKNAQDEKIPLLGFDAAYVVGETTRPSLEDSWDYSGHSYLVVFDPYRHAIKFIEERAEKGLRFEIVLGKPGVGNPMPELVAMIQTSWTNIRVGLYKHEDGRFQFVEEGIHPDEDGKEVWVQYTESDFFRDIEDAKKAMIEWYCIRTEEEYRVLPESVTILEAPDFVGPHHPALIPNHPTDARWEIGKVARAMLAGEMSFIEGARRLVPLGFNARLDNDPDILRFNGIRSETDALPFGEVRQHWQTRALERLQPEIDRLETWAREFGQVACQNLAKRFGGSDATKSD